MNNIVTYKRNGHDNEYEVDCHIGDCICKEHPESIDAFLLECRERAPIGFKVLSASRGDCNEKSHNP